MRNAILALPPGESKERDLTWLDWSVVSAISPDGKTLLFSETGEGGGAGYSVYIRKTDGSPAVRLGEGNARDLSPNGKWALVIVHPPSGSQLVAYPTGAGEPKLFSREGLAVSTACWLLTASRSCLRRASRDTGRGSTNVTSQEGNHMP